MGFFDGWDTQAARWHLVLLVLLLLAGEGARWMSRERLPPVGPGGEYLPPPAFSGDPALLSEKEKWIRGLPMELGRARAEDLSLLPGVGPQLAARIAAWVRENGSPPSLEGLRQVKGVGPATLSLLKQNLRLPAGPRD